MERRTKLSQEDRTNLIVDRGSKCEECDVGIEGTLNKHNLHIHHVVKIADGGSDDPDNLRVLCIRCHRKAHGKIPRDEMWRYLKRGPKGNFIKR